jgi:HAD superfamily phosphoserine phosphatase-like hydrolase
MVPLAMSHVLKMKRADNGAQLQCAKIACIASMLRGLPQWRLESVLNRFSSYVYPMIRPEIKASFVKCVEAGCAVVVTASPDFVVGSIFPGLQFPVLGTRFITSKGYFTGNVDGISCYGEEKVRRVEEYIAGLRDSSVRVAEAWSDALSDLPMMNMANIRYWVCNSTADYETVQTVDPDGRALIQGNS